MLTKEKNGLDLERKKISSHNFKEKNKSVCISYQWHGNMKASSTLKKVKSQQEIRKKKIIIVKMYSLQGGFLMHFLL